MDYKKFCSILNKHIFEGEKKELLKKIAERPERFIGLFRPTKPRAKVLQHILQSHEIRFGDAMEELLSEFLKEWHFIVLPKIVVPNPKKKKKTLDIDQYFTDRKIYYFIEQKVRDDHDSTKKKGQIENFEAKLEFLYKKHKKNLEAIMYFIDPDLIKNKKFYSQELKKMNSFYGVKTCLFYGKELFEFMNYPEVWEQILSWLKEWKNSLVELPEIDFDKTPKGSFKEIKDLELRYWRKILENEKLWTEGIIKAIFRKGETLKLVFDYFKTQKDKPYQELAVSLEQLLKKFY